MLYPRYHSNYSHMAVPSGSSKPYPCNGGTRENLNASALRLGSDGSYGCILLPRTNRQLSGRTRFRTVFVTAFFVLPILYHVRVKKSNVFLAKMHNFFLPQKQAFHPAEKHKNCLLTNRPVCALMAFIHSIKTLTEILLFSEVPESRRLVRAGADERMQSASRVGPVNGASSVMGPGGPRYRDRTCWSLKGSPYGR